MESPQKPLNELIARRLAALKMGLIKDEYGLKLPEDLWRQMLPMANAAEEIFNEFYTTGTNAIR